MLLNKQAKGFFVTATDTGAGKTTVTQALIYELIKKGYLAIGCKPIACGTDIHFLNEDALAYKRINSINLPMNDINPLCFELPVSPNIAAKAMGKHICLDQLIAKLHQHLCLPIDYIFYEGIGGWKVPINESETTADLAVKLQLPLIFVIGIRVGCLNHALLTWESIVREEIPVAGWIANVIDTNTPAIPEHITTLQHRISAPYLGMLTYQNAIIDLNSDLSSKNLNPRFNIEPFLTSISQKEE